MSALLAIDPGTSAGFALFRGREVVWCAQVDTKGLAWNAALERYRVTLRDVRGALMLNEWMEEDFEIVMELPCYAANRTRRQGTSEALAERVGMLRALAWSILGRAPRDVGWQAWQAVAHAGRVLGDSEDRSLGYAREVLKVPAEWLQGPRGGVLWDAATACAIGGAVLGIRRGEAT